MNLSMKWLADYVKVDKPIREFCYEMTMTGSKVEGYEVQSEGVKNVVVGEVLSVTPHENSDHLVVCSVNVGGGEPVQIVTGAQNVHAGDIVPVALDGSVLPNGTKIKKGKLRGVVSNGMLCSLGELKLTTHDFPYAVEDGIFIMEEPCEIGQDICSAIGIDDTSVEFEITPNRADCLSILGLAREASATFKQPLNYKKPTYHGNDEDINSFLSVEVREQKLCNRYSAGLVKNVKIAPSPRWLRERLRACGVRPINNLVDITNYVMLEYGHPMHAFDAKFVEGGKIVVRKAAEGEEITTLDGVKRSLTTEMLVICDEKKPMAVAGVMGGEHSGIMEDTTTVVFEAACFDGASVRLTSKKLGLRSDSSSRFEKGLDASNAPLALARAFELVEELSAGEVVGSVIDKDYSDKTPRAITFNPDWINSFLGTNIPRENMVSYLTSLEFKVDGDTVIAPSFRTDIEGKADIAEEVARIFGYNNIPSTLMRGISQAKFTPIQKYNRKLEQSLLALGFNEIRTYSFISPKYFDKISLPKDSDLRKTVTILNPLGEDTSVMRTTTIPSICEVLSRNYNNRNLVARLYEIGNEYLPTTPDKLPTEPARLSLGLYGDCDFYDLKGAVEEILEEAGISGYEISAAAVGCGFDEISAFHPGRVAVITKDDVLLGIMGELHPEVLENYEIGVKAYAAKLNIPEMISVSVVEKQYKQLPKFPATTRDLSVVCNEETPVAALEKAIRTAAGVILEKVSLFDVYKGKQVEDGKKSVSYSISLRSHEGTLTDEQADSAVKKILKALSEVGAEIRS